MTRFQTYSLWKSMPVTSRSQQRSVTDVTGIDFNKSCSILLRSRSAPVRCVESLLVEFSQFRRFRAAFLFAFLVLYISESVW